MLLPVQIVRLPVDVCESATEVTGWSPPILCGLKKCGWLYNPISYVGLGSVKGLSMVGICGYRHRYDCNFAGAKNGLILIFGIIVTFRAL